MRRPRTQRGEGRLGCALWLLFAGLIAYAGYQMIPVRFGASRFQDFMTQEAAFGNQKSNVTIVQELLAQARELDLPITKDQIEVTRTRELITISVHYEVPIVFFGTFRFVWKFNPTVVRPLITV